MYALVAIDVGGHRVWMLIDNGASINLIHRRVLENIIKNTGRAGLEQLQFKRETLPVSVANGQVWMLESAVQLTMHIAGRAVTAEFWVSDELSEDMLLGLKTQREYSMSTHTRTKENGGDYLQICEYDKEHIPLQNAKQGLVTTAVAMSSRKAITLQPGINRVLLPPQVTTRISWPTEMKGMAVTGILTGS